MSPIGADFVSAGSSVKAWSFEKAVAVAGGHARLERAAVAVDGQRYLDPRLAQRPHLAEKTGKVADLGVVHRQHDVAGAQVGAPRRPARETRAITTLSSTSVALRPSQGRGG